ncbi:integrase domain-containing protein [Enterovibrio norvegicus]|uniref:integrase domain-containing protein n=1 Tax=Enterovibrio norvegicus TaxID=188144 RepID=UPI0024B19049|nr:integrase domain-containing protein [Enterovibrio norvegicus]
MARMVVPLTDTEIRHAKPKDKPYILYDGGNLELSVRPSGKKVWIFVYSRPYTKKRTKLTLGPYPTLTLSNARRKREEYTTLLLDNIDPQEYLDSEKRRVLESIENTLSKVAAAWFQVKKNDISEDYAEDVWRSLERHVFPKLGHCPITKLSAQQTIAVLNPIAKKGNLETVRRLCQRLNEIMIYAINTGILFANPLGGIKAAFIKPQKQNMATIKPEELPAFLKALSRASINNVTRCMIEWQLHTMTRPNETSGAQWDEINFEEKVWSIPASRMKAKREHVVPLTPQTLAILEEMKAISGHRVHVFPGNGNPTKPANSQTANMAIKRMGYKDLLVAHGLRSIASTALNESKAFDADLIESALAHKDHNEVRSAYNRAHYLELRRELMAWWSNYIDDACSKSLRRH